MRAAFVIFVFTFFIVAILVGPFREFREMENEANVSKKIANGLSSSNAFLAGQIEGQKNIVQTLQKEIDDNKRDNETALLNLKTDLNEANRQRDAALQRLDFFESNPERLSEIYSNIFANAPTNFQQLELAYRQFTNVMNNVGELPKLANLELHVNDEINLVPTESIPSEPILIGNNITLTDRTIRLKLFNVSKITAVNGFVAFQSTLEFTNLIADGWEKQPIGSVFAKSSLRYNSEKSLPQYTFWDIATLIISTNYTTRSFDVQILAGADNAESKRYLVHVSMP